MVILILSVILLGLLVYLIFASKKKDFYSEKKDFNDIRNYLTYVYPLCDWYKISNKKLLRFYNKLTFYYNPCSTYMGDDLSGINTNPYDKSSKWYMKEVVGTTWGELPSCNQLGSVRAPTGRFLSFENYHRNNNIDVVLTGKELLRNHTSYRQTLHWGVTSSGGEVSRKCRSGPGPYWITPFSLMRDMYYPNGIYFKDNRWSIKCNMSKNIFNHGCEGDTNWTYGKQEGEYIEVSHSQNVPGMAQSIGAWFNGYPLGGTGIFLKIGKTRVAHNKVDMLFLLLTELISKDSDSLYDSMKSTTYANMSGSDILNILYKTDDAYEITWKYINGEWGPMAYTNNGYPVIDPRNKSWSYIGNKGILSASGLMNNPTSINTSVGDGNGYHPNETVKFKDTAIWWLKENNIEPVLTSINKKKVIDAARNPETSADYFPNRAGGLVTPDEPMCWLGFVLEIETLQLPMSVNDNGLWCYEIIDLRLPEVASGNDGIDGLPSKYSTMITNAKSRHYDFLTTPLNEVNTTVGSGGNITSGIFPTWDPVVRKWWMESLKKYLSVRNPMDMEHGNNCIGIGYVDDISPTECGKDAYPSSIINLPMLNFSGNYEKNHGGRCWTAVEGKGWQNLPCARNTLSNQYIKVPLMYPSIEYIKNGKNNPLNKSYYFHMKYFSNLGVNE